MAGARVGFALAEAELRERLRELLGPWPVSGPARWAATQALADRDWQAQTRLRLEQASKRLVDLLQRQGLFAAGGAGLFQWLPPVGSGVLAGRLGATRNSGAPLADPPGLRFGLPGAELHWQRLEWAPVGVRAERLC